MLRAELVHAGHAEQLQRADDVGAQDLRDLRHARAAARHQPVEVGPPDEGGGGAERDGRHDVAAVHDAGVDEHLRPSAQRLDGGLDQLQRHGGAVELAAAVVGEQHAVGARVDHPERVVHALHALDHELARPGVAQPFDVGHGQRGVEHPVDHLFRGAARRERRERERLGGEQVEPPVGVHRAVDERLEREGGRDREAVADVAEARPARRGVHGEHEGVVARRRGALDEVLAERPVAPEVELEPQPGVGGGGGEVLDGRGAHRRQRVGHADLLRDRRHRALALGLHHPGEAGGGEREREGGALAEDVAAGVDRRHVVQHRRAGTRPGRTPPGRGGATARRQRRRRSSRTPRAACAAGRSAAGPPRRRRGAAAVWRRPGRTGRAAAAGRARRAGAGDAGPSTQRKPIRPSVAGPDASATAPRCRARPRPADRETETRRRENGDSPSREWRLAVSGGGGPARRRPPHPRSPRPATPPRRAWGWPAARPGAVAPTPTGRSSRSPAPARPARAAPP